MLGLFTTGVSVVLLLSGAQNFKFDMLPYWKGETALYGLLALGLAGIVTAILAFRGKWKPLIVVYTLAAFALIVYGFFISPVYRFAGQAEARNALYLALIALSAFLASLMHLRDANRA